MMTALAVLGTIIFVLVLILGVILSFLGLYGTIVILLDGVIYSACTHWQHPSPGVLLALLALTLLAESADYILGFAGVKRSGGSNKTGLWSMLGGLVGVIVGGWLSPVLGALGLGGGIVGFVFGVVLPPLAVGLIGGYLGGYWYELRQGKSRPEAARAGKGALWGRLQGALAKTLVAGIMAAILISAIHL